LRIKLKGIESFSVTYDYWTSNANKGFLTLTIHFVDKDFQLRDYVLKTLEITEAHTGINSAKAILSILDEFGLNCSEPSKIFAVSDAAGNKKKAAKELHWRHFPCFAHALHNVMTSSFNDEVIRTLLIKARKLAKHFRSSPKQSSLLIKIQQKLHLPNIKLKLGVETRWNSMYDRLISNKTPIINLALEHSEIQALNLTLVEWEKLMTIKEVLRPFKEITDLLSTAKMPSISMVKPLINNIQNNLLKILETDNYETTILKNSIADAFSNKINQYNNVEEVLEMSSLLDPRFKTLILI